MLMPGNEQYSDLETLTAVIAYSQIIVVAPSLLRPLPASFDATDVAILEWIAAEGRRAGRSLLRM